MRTSLQRIGPTTALLIMAAVQPCSANPTSKAPNRPIAAHGTIDGAKQLVADLYQLYDEEEQLVIKYHDMKDNPARWSDRMISKSAGRLWKARRDADHLRLMGEPAAIDLNQKLTLLAIEVDKFGQTYRGTPRGSQLLGRIRTKLQREAAGLNRFLGQAAQALEQGKLEIFDTQMEKKGVELYEQLVFFTPTERRKYNANFNALLSQGTEALTKQRKEQYRDAAAATLPEQVAPAASLADEGKRIAGEIAASGTASLSDDVKGDAVDATAHVVKLWGNASAGLARAAAIQWAMLDRARVQVQPTPEQLKSAALASLAGIVEAAAQSTPPENVQQTYSGLLQQISAADRRIGTFSDEVFKACEPALQKLIAKDPALAQRIARYKRATSEVLKWRQQYTYQQAANLERQFPAGSSLVSSEAEMPNVRPNFVRFPPRKTTVAPPTFITPANWMVQEAAANLVGQPVSEKMMLRLSPNVEVSVVPFDGSHFANVPATLPTSNEVEDMLTAIVVDELHGPLTRESADAVSAAELHDYAVVAGLIEQVHLESVVSRFASLPDVASPLVRLGELPSINVDTPPLTQTCWRFDIRPVWVRHPYFVVRVPSN